MRRSSFGVQWAEKIERLASGRVELKEADVPYVAIRQLCN